jgi:hypothetical protein
LNGQDSRQSFGPVLPAECCFCYHDQSWQAKKDIPKFPHLPEEALYCLQNVVSATMIKAGRPKPINIYQIYSGFVSSFGEC